MTHLKAVKTKADLHAVIDAMPDSTQLLIIGCPPAPNGGFTYDEYGGLTVERAYFMAAGFSHLMMRLLDGD